MEDGILFIKEGIAKLKAGLNDTVYAVEKEVRELGTICSDDYARAVLDEDFTEIYFYRFAPEGFPGPDEKLQVILEDPQKKMEYRGSCYNGWKNEILRVQEIVARHNGRIQIHDLSLQDYFDWVQNTGETPCHRVNVRVSVPGQDKLRSIRGLEAAVGNYEASATE